MKKKGQEVGQIFIYILAAMIAGGILFYGYTAVKTFSKQAEEVTFIKFKTGVENDFRDVASDYGTVKIRTYEPGAFAEACFIDKAVIEAQGANYGGILDGYPIIKDAVGSGIKDDMYLLPGEKHIELGVVETPPTHPVQCFKVRSGRFTVRLEGTGNSVIVSEAPQQ